jgi:hypothetical protein
MTTIQDTLGREYGNRNDCLSALLHGQPVWSMLTFIGVFLQLRRKI